MIDILQLREEAALAALNEYEELAADIEQERAEWEATKSVRESRGQERSKAFGTCRKDCKRRS